MCGKDVNQTWQGMRAFLLVNETFTLLMFLSLSFDLLISMTGKGASRHPMRKVRLLASCTTNARGEEVSMLSVV